MNICILSTRYPSKDNMVHVFVKKLVDEWAKAGHHCVVISPVSKTKILLGKVVDVPYYHNQEVADGIFVDVYRPRYWHLPSLKIGGVGLTKMSHQKSIENAIAKTGLKFDFIYGHFFSIAVEGWRYAKSNNIPLFAATGESVVTLPAKPCREFTLDQYRKNLCGVVAVSTKNKIEASEKGIIDIEKTEVFPNGVNLELFSRLDKQKCRQKLGFPHNAFIVICVGQFIERKGQRRILQALDKLNHSSIKSIFLGKGEDDFEHPSIIFKGTTKNTQLPYYLNAADLFVLPTRKEGCCNAIIEALACGLPIVSSDLPFNHDVLNKENAILVDPDNIDEIANGIEAVYSNVELAQLLAENAYKQRKQYSIEARASKILNFIKERIKERNE